MLNLHQEVPQEHHFQVQHGVTQTNCSVVVPSAKLGSLTGALQAAQCGARAVEEEEEEEDEEEKEQSVMHLRAQAEDELHTTVFESGTALTT